MKHNPIDLAVEEYSSPIEAHATEQMSLEDMHGIMSVKGFRHLPVLRNNKPVGMISLRDLNLLKSLNKHFELTASDIMSQDPYCVVKGSSIGEVAFHMSERKIGSAIVVNENGEADSIFTSIDGLNALVEIVRGEY